MPQVNRYRCAILLSKLIEPVRQRGVVMHQRQSAWPWGLAVVVMVLAVLAGASATVALAVRHHGLSEIIVTGVNVGLLAVACLALVVARSQAVAARAANALTEQARQEAAAKEREAAAQAIADSQRATRPYLWADLVPGIAGPPTWDLVIHNTGRTPAREVILEPEPWPAMGDKLGDRLREQLPRPFDLPPGASLRLAWRIAHEDDEPGNVDQPAGMPDETTLTLRYRGDDPLLAPFSETRLLDLPTRAGIIPAPREGAVAGGTDLYGVLKNINYAVRSLGGHVAELRR